MLVAASIETPRLRLEPLRPADIDELFLLLDDASLHTYIGGEPMTHSELERWVAFVAQGRSPSWAETWCNWTIRLRDEGAAVGTAQATIVDHEASVAWVIGSAWQGRGFAKEAASAVATWLRAHDVPRLRANIHSDHVASNAVARSLGLAPTDQRDDGEVVWRSG